MNAETKLTETRVTSRDFNREPSRVKKAALQGPVVVTERGEPSMVVMSYAEYQRLTGNGRTLYDLMASLPELPDTPEIEETFEEINRRRKDLFRPIDFD